MLEPKWLTKNNLNQRIQYFIRKVLYPKSKYHQNFSVEKFSNFFEIFKLFRRNFDETFVKNDENFRHFVILGNEMLFVSNLGIKESESRADGLESEVRADKARRLVADGAVPGHESASRPEVMNTVPERPINRILFGLEFGQNSVRFVRTP